ncbi:adenylate/guanylate cyclase domain-containing protein [Ascidiimonas sp. W6]|uniref:adenylate/guanylate cyclase domain-containing protein n=1 Tax=Ascidiimonas meishanensis TaxID=3128903 RepID=UPI0030EB9047
MNSTRRLAAIVFVDIEGYTAMMQKDEDNALKVVKNFRKNIDTCVPKYNGEIIQYYGDGCLLIFNSALEAIKCSKSLQQSFKGIPPEVPVRIGIHLGDIVVESGNIFGDNVNIAARIESMSIAGAILLSEKVRNELINQPHIKLESLGSYEFKNVETPIEVFAYVREGFTMPKKSEIAGKFKIQNEEKSIAVLAFKNQSSDSEQEYFSEGIAEEIIYGLSKLDNLKVAGRMSSFSFKDSKETLAEIAEQLKVNHILEGTVRKAGSRIRVNVQCVNVVNGFQIWTERFDRELKDVFSIQDEIAEKVVEKMKISLLGQEKGQNIISRKTENVEAYELYLQGRGYLDKRTSVEQALSCFNKAIGIDPNFAAAYTGVAYAYFYKVIFDNYEPRIGWPKAAIAIQKALSFDDSNAEAHTMKAKMDFYFHHHPEKARLEYEKAVMLQPKFADTYRVKSYFHIMMDEQELAIENAKKCLELDPLSFNNNFSLGDIYYRSKRYLDAIEVFEKMNRIYPQDITVQIMLGVLYYMIDAPEKSNQILDQINPQSIGLDVYANERFVVAARSGNKELAREHLKRLVKTKSENWVSPTVISILYFSLEENENGLESLYQAAKDNDPVLHMITVLPLWDDYTKLPSVKAFLKSWKSDYEGMTTNEKSKTL